MFFNSSFIDTALSDESKLPMSCRDFCKCQHFVKIETIIETTLQYCMNGGGGGGGKRYTGPGK